MDNNNNIDLQWRELSNKAIVAVPDDPDYNMAYLEDFHVEKKTPRGCSITNGSDEMRKWVCKMYLGGKQRILGYGSAYQCARLYDAAFWRFAKYRIERDSDTLNTQQYNISESQASDDNTINADMVNLLCGFEELLINNNLLHTPEQRALCAKQSKADRNRNRYTFKGRMERLLEQIFGMVEQSALSILAIEKRLERLEQHNERKSGIFMPPPFQPVNPGPGYTAPVIGDDLNAPTFTCVNPNHSGGGTIVTCKSEGSV